MGCWLRAVLIGVVASICGLYGLCAASLVLLKWVNPWTTAVQAERRVDSILHGRPYHKQYRFVPLRQIAPDLQRALLAAEDERFREHSGIDWIEVKKAIEDEMRHGRKPARGASTITQQLVKNLYFSTSRSLVRKGLEFTVVPFAESILGKDRILELYLNIIEWGPGIYGAEAAARAYYGIPASRLNRDQAARLAACVPAPSKRRPAAMGGYAGLIELRMRQMGW